MKVIAHFPLKQCVAGAKNRGARPAIVEASQGAELVYGQGVGLGIIPEHNSLRPRMTNDQSDRR